MRAVERAITTPSMPLRMAPTKTSLVLGYVGRDGERCLRAVIADPQGATFSISQLML